MEVWAIGLGGWILGFAMQCHSIIWIPGPIRAGIDTNFQQWGKMGKVVQSDVCWVFQEARTAAIRKISTN